MTPRQLQIFRFIEDYFVRNGYAPTLDEIGAAMKVTKVTVLSHLRRLEDAGHIRRTTYRHRGIEVLSHGHSIPLAGTIAAGAPIDALETTDRIDLLAELRGKPDLFALRVKGDSMKDDGIHDGDVGRPRVPAKRWWRSCRGARPPSNVFTGKRGRSDFSPPMKIWSLCW